MGLSFYETFSSMLKIIAMAGVYVPGSDVLHPQHPVLVKSITYIIHFTSVLLYIMEMVNEITYAIWIKAEGMTDVFLTLILGFFLPIFTFPIYANWKSRDIEEIIHIWEKDLIHPPFPADRRAEIAKTQRNMFIIANVQIVCIIIPFAFWSGRTIFTKKPIFPILYTGDISVSPTLEIAALIFSYLGYCLTSLWCGTENVKFMFMKSILTELNHLYTATEKILTFESSEVYEKKSEKRQRELAAKEENLRTWIIYHQAVIRLADKVNNFLGPVLLLQDLSFIIFFSTGSLMVMMGDIPFQNSVSGTFFLSIYCCVQFMIYNLGGEIQRKSSVIFETFHGRNYQLYTKKIIKNIIFVQYISTHRPITIRATWYNDLSRKSLSELLKKGFEMLMFMRFLITRNKI